MHRVSRLMCSNNTAELSEKVWQKGEQSAADVSAHHPILVIGLGNPILGDDGAGWRVADLVQVSMPTVYGPFVRVNCLSVGGLSLMEALIGCQRAIIIDTINTGTNPAGTLMVIPLEQLPEHFQGHLSSAHDASLQNAIRVGLYLGAALPKQIIIVGIESPCVYDFSEQITPPISACIPEAAQKVLQLIHQWAEPLARAPGG